MDAFILRFVVHYNYYLCTYIYGNLLVLVYQIDRQDFGETEAIAEDP